MNGRSGRPSRGAAMGPPGPDPQVGFYLLPPDQNPREHHKSSKKSKSHHSSSRRAGGQSRRWASQNQLDVITEASDESR